MGHFAAILAKFFAAIDRQTRRSCAADSPDPASNTTWYRSSSMEWLTEYSYVAGRLSPAFPALGAHGGK